MRLLALDLRAFGRFTDFSLDLSAGDGGLHLVYGPNEAGKSTALRAIHDLFYGIYARTPYDFRHGYDELRIGGRLRHSSGTELAIVRRKGTRNTLLGPDEKPFDGRMLAPYLGGITSDEFLRVFGINADGLARGGQEMLAGEGALGESIYTASLGGVSLRQILDGLAKEADDLFTRRGHIQTINAKLRDLEKAKQRMREASLSPRDWGELVEGITAVEADLARVTSELRDRGIERTRLDRIRRALPKLGDRDVLVRRIEEIGEVIALPEDFAKRLHEARTLHATGTDQLKNAEDELVRLTDQIKAIPPPEALLAQEEAITRLFKGLDAYQQAGNDRPDLAAKCHAHESAAREILRDLRPDLDLASVEMLRLNADRRTAIGKVGNRRTQVMGDAERTLRAVEEATTALENARRELDAAPPARDAGELRRAASRIRGRNLEERRDEAGNKAEDNRRKANAALARLPGWTGSLAELASTPVPGTETVSRFEDEFQRTTNALDRADERIAAAPAGWLTASLADRARTGIVALYAVAALLGFLAVVAIAASAITGGLSFVVTGAVAVGIAFLSLREARALSTHAKLVGERARLTEEMSALNDRWRRDWESAHVAPATPREMRAWLSERAGLVAAAESIAAIETEIAGLKAAITEVRAELNAALSTLGETPSGANESLAALLDRSDDIVAVVDKENLARTEIERRAGEAERRLATAVTERDAAEAALAHWRDEWAATLAPLGLSVETTPDDANAVLLRIDDLFGKMRDAEALKERIGQIDAWRTAFEARVAAIRDLSPDLADRPVEFVVGGLNARVTAARENAATLAGLKKQVAAQEKARRAAEDSIRRANEEIRELRRIAGGAESEELETIERRYAERTACREKLAAIDRDLRAIGEGVTVDDLIAQAAEIDPEAFPGQITEVAERIAAFEEERSRLHEQLGEKREKQRAMDGSPVAADAAAEAQAVLGELRALVDRYVRVRLAETVLRREIDRYRERNEAPLLTRAAEIFSRLTLGSFAGLKPYYGDEEHPVIHGVRAGSDEQVGVEGMSDGTRDQLYLALRLAALERWLEMNEPIPFVVDDILIRFDAERARATLAVLAELAAKTQVLFFTHNERLVEIAGDLSAPAGTFVHALA